MKLSEALAKLEESAKFTHNQADTVYVNVKNCISWEQSKKLITDLRNSIQKEFPSIEFNSVTQTDSEYGFIDWAAGLSIIVNREINIGNFLGYCARIYVVYTDKMVESEQFKSLKDYINRFIMVETGMDGYDYSEYLDMSTPITVYNYIPTNVYIKPSDDQVKMGDLIPVMYGAGKIEQVNDVSRTYNLLNNIF